MARIILFFAEAILFLAAAIVLTNFVDPRRYIVVWPTIFVLVVLIHFYVLKKIRDREAARD